MGHDFQVERGESFGEWLHKEMLEAVTFEDAPWAIARFRRVEARLQAGRTESNRLKVAANSGRELGEWANGVSVQMRSVDI
jgi:urease accessory protein UreF